jgi:hypothetical protein
MSAGPGIGSYRYVSSEPVRIGRDVAVYAEEMREPVRSHGDRQPMDQRVRRFGAVFEMKLHKTARQLLARSDDVARLCASRHAF